MADATDDARRVRELERRLAELEAEGRLGRAADAALEVALRDRLSLEGALALMFPVLLEHLDATEALVRTFDENLALETFSSESAGDRSSSLRSRVEAIVEVTDGREAFLHAGDGRVELGQHLDVAGELFGMAAVAFDRDLDEAGQALARRLLDTWCEVLDNYLASIAQARNKHRILGELSTALREPVLDRGIEAAIEVLRDNVEIKDLLLVFRHEEDVEQATLHYKIIQDGELTHDSHAAGDMEVDEFIRTHAARMLQGEARELLDRFGIERYREELLINGVREERIVGKLVVTRRAGAFDTFDRDLLERFADTLRQRIVDFNREWKHLSLCFPPATVHRLLAEEGYLEEHLRPREADVVILYCDISGFTRISEQVLREPALIGELVNTWSARVVDLIWDSGGVFDKMVGDCVIGLWGPPFFDRDARTLCRRAARVARDIRDYTRDLNVGAQMPQLASLQTPIGVATALSYSPLYVGLFGPNEDYTGFSSGMNNTARLQGVAARDEILCMLDFVEAHGEPGSFGEERSAEVKNVSEPLRYRALK